MIDRDDELDKLLKPLKCAQPSDLQMQKWKNAIDAEAKKQVVTLARSKYFAQIAAAVLIGIAMGAVLFQRSRPMTAEETVAATFSESNATFEHSHTNLD